MTPPRRAILAGMLASLAGCGGPGYEVVADLGTALIVVASPTLGPQDRAALGKAACGTRATCQARIWTDRQWAPKGTDWPPGARETIAVIVNRFPGEGGEYHRVNCRRFPQTPPERCIPF